MQKITAAAPDGCREGLNLTAQPTDGEQQNRGTSIFAPHVAARSGWQDR